MTLAEVDLELESWELLRLGISLVQPLLVLLLVLGLVVALAQLLTMIGTRWGDYRTTGKSLLFSVGFHVLLACGLIAMIPEYQSRLSLTVVEQEAEPIRIHEILEPSEFDAQQGPAGNSPFVEDIPRTDPIDWSRIATPPELASANQPPDRPPEFPEFRPQPAPDQSRPDVAQVPVPQQEAMTRQMDLQPAELPQRAEPLPVPTRPEANVPAASLDRRPSTVLAPRDEVLPERAATGGVDRLDIQPSPDRQAADLPEQMAPAPAAVRGADQELANRDGPQLFPSPALMLGQNRPQLPAAGGVAVEPRISRTESRLPVVPEEAPGISRVRPDIPAPLPDGRRMLNDNTLRGRDDVPLSAISPPSIPRPDDPFLRRDERDRMPSVYRLRNEQERERALRNYGGTVETEQAVDRALKWLASQQDPAGFWDASAHGAGVATISQDGIDRQGAGATADVGVTALAVLAFLGKLNTVDQGDYSGNVNRALKWIVAQQKVRVWGGEWGSNDGYLGGEATDFEAMYCHGMATFALGEAYVMSRDNADAQWLRPPLEKAINFILQTQIPDGGWRYIKGQPEGDMSMFGWQLMALKSAEAAGIAIDPRHKALMEKFLASRQRGPSGGLAGYLPREAPSAAMTAEAMYCRQILGVPMDAAASKEAVELILSRPPERVNFNLYYWYYGTLAMFQHGGPDWDKWNLALRDLLVSEQRTSGELAGSWDPRDLWGPYGGRIYSTAIATLSLEVYYRYLPLYRIKEN